MLYVSRNEYFFCWCFFKTILLVELTRTSGVESMAAEFARGSDGDVALAVSWFFSR